MPTEPATEARPGNPTPITLVAISAITRDPDLQVRVAIDPATVARYAELVRDGQSLEPVVLFDDGEHLWLADGHHTIAGYEGAGNDQVPAVTRKGTKRDAQDYACSANGRHGLPLSNADKRRIVGIRLADPEWSKASDRAIAKLVGVSHPFVAALRRGPEPAGPNVPVHENDSAAVTGVGETGTVEPGQPGGNGYHPGPDPVGIDAASEETDQTPAAGTPRQEPMAHGRDADREMDPGRALKQAAVAAFRRVFAALEAAWPDVPNEYVSGPIVAALQAAGASDDEVIDELDLASRLAAVLGATSSDTATDQEYEIFKAAQRMLRSTPRDRIDVDRLETLERRLHESRR